jgi:hypothetical protein
MERKRTLTTIIIFFLLSISFIPSGSIFAVNIAIENNYFKYEIQEDGKNLHFIDKSSGFDYYDAETDSYCAYVTQGGKDYRVTSVSLKDNLLSLEFSEAGVTAEIFIKISKNQATLEVTQVKGSVESLTFINIPLSLEGLPNEPFAACVLSMNLHTHVRQLPALQDHLQATCYERFGMVGAKITLLGVPQENILPAIRHVMKNAKDVPLSTEGGAWAQMQEEGYSTRTGWRVENSVTLRIGSELMEFTGATDSPPYKFTGLKRGVNGTKLGVWIKGDGNGELLNFRIESSHHLSHGARGDHFVKINFTGWKYFELVEIESSEFSNFIWPAPFASSSFFVYDSYRHTVDYNNVDKLQLWYNNLPADKEVKCVVGPVKALPMVSATIEHPSITIGGETIVFRSR